MPLLVCESLYSISQTNYVWKLNRSLCQLPLERSHKSKWNHEVTLCILLQQGWTSECNIQTIYSQQGFYIHPFCMHGQVDPSKFPIDHMIILPVIICTNKRFVRDKFDGEPNSAAGDASVAIFTSNMHFACHTMPLDPYYNPSTTNNLMPWNQCVEKNNDIIWLCSASE